MPSLSYCRHENTLQEMRQVHEMWEDEVDNSYEIEARKHLETIILELAEWINAEREAKGE